MEDQLRQRVASASPYEPLFGFSRAVRTGQFIAVAGTAPIGKDGSTIPGDVATQARRCFEIVQEALENLGASLSDVTRTRIFLINIEDWQKVGQIHGEFFAAIRPVTTFMQVARFIDPAWLIEVEVDAIQTSHTALL